MQVNLDELRQRIRSAFAHVTSPTKIADMRRAGITSDDSFEMAEAFVGKKWSELPLDTVFYHRESLAALNASAYRAYVAAYLLGAIASMDPLDRHGPDLHHYLVASLEPGPHATERVAALDAEQRAVVRDVLRVIESIWHMPEARDAASAV